MYQNIPDGVYPTMLTPFTDNNEIDYNAVEKLLYWYADRGVAGVFAICQSSEIFFLSFEERLALLRFIMTHKPAGMKIVASGNVERDAEKQIEEAKAFVETGIDAYVFISNRLADEDEDDETLWRNMSSAADKLPEIGLGIYECPYPYKRVLSPEIMRRMGESGRFLFLKDTCCDLTLIRKKTEAAAGTPLKIFNANAATLLDSLRLGCAGYSGVMANFHPEVYARLCEIWESDPATAGKLQDFVGFFSVAECQCYPVNAKYYLSLEGLPIRTNTRVRDKSELTASRKLEIQQMRALTERFKIAEQIG